jgi:ATP synthase
MPSTLLSLKVTLLSRTPGMTAFYSNSMTLILASISRNAMDNASKNAGDMIGSLQMQYNRGRQAAITNELVDIITGMGFLPAHSVDSVSLTFPLSGASAL